MKKKLTAAALLALASTEAGAVRLNLVCTGEGETRRSSVSESSSTRPYGYMQRERETVVQHRTEDFVDQVNVEIRHEDGRIRLPRTMLPALHGGEDGWMELFDIQTTANEITAKARVNFMSHPDIRIDRITGAISISGRIGHFAGTCEAFDPETVQRRF